jgi:hypothetical protein
MPGFLYQTIRIGKRARQRRDRERVCVRDSVSLKVKESVGQKMERLEETFGDGHV